MKKNDKWIVLVFISMILGLIFKVPFHYVWSGIGLFVVIWLLKRE